MRHVNGIAQEGWCSHWKLCCVKKSITTSIIRTPFKSAGYPKFESNVTSRDTQVWTRIRTVGKWQFGRQFGSKLCEIPAFPIPEVDVAESCLDEGFVCEVKGFVISESDEEREETAEPMAPPPLGSLTVVEYIASLKQLVSSKALDEEYFAALNNLKMTIIGSALTKQSKLTNFFGKKINVPAIWLPYPWLPHLLGTLGYNDRILSDRDGH